jgi:diguanylate cyclase (GGDEF)-like protein
MMMNRETSRWILVAAAAAALPLLATRGLSGEARVAASTLPALLAALACVTVRMPLFLGAARNAARLGALALLVWVAFDLGALVPLERGVGLRAAGTLCLAALFVTLVLALDARPHLAPPEPLSASRILERIGAVVFVFGLLVYATGGGEAAPAGRFELLRRGLVLLLALYLTVRLLDRARACPAGAWRSGYLTLAIGGASVAASVTLQLLVSDKVFVLRSLLRSAGPLAMLGAAVLVGRAEPIPSAEGADDGAAPRPEPLAQLWSGPLIAYAAAFPVVHLAGYGLGSFDPALRHVREVVALVLLFGLGALALWHQKELQRQVDDVTQRFKRVSQFDPLTGLASRNSFLERAGRSLARVKRVPGYQFALLVVELERFKLIENAFGPRFARDLVVGLAERLKKCLRPGDMVASLGQDRFAVLADHIRPTHAVRDLGELAQRIGGSVLGPAFGSAAEAAGQSSQAAEIAQRILRDAVSPPIAVDAREVYPRGSIGIATSDTGYADAEELLRDAQAAVRRAKLRGGDTYELFDPDMQAESLARVVVESELHRAVERGELMLEYQPIVRLDQVEIAGFEALLRWRHPSRGVLRPAEFLAAADTTGLIVPITRWVIHEACQRASEWQGLSGRPLFVSCNIAGPQFRTGALREAVAAALRESGLDGRQLKLEITEGVAIASYDAVLRSIAELEELGVDFLLDDFGTGYSSLSYLHRLPVKGLKIDRSFVLSLPQDSGALALVRGIVELAKELKRDVIAEGIETREQRDSVSALGCPLGQGYYLGMPSEAATLASLLQTGPAGPV